MPQHLTAGTPERSKFPLQLFGFHFKARTHSSYGNVDVLKAACRQEVWLNPVDAEKRGIKTAIRCASLTTAARCEFRK
jgi:Tat-targeted selenate reductase subunit YnfE